MRFLFTFLLILIAPLWAFGQLISNPYPPDPAAAAVGCAAVASATGVDAVYANPAGLAFGKGTQGRFVYHNPWSLSFLSHMSAVVYSSLPSKPHGFALGVQTLGTRMGGSTMASETEAFFSHGFLLQQDIHSSLAFGYSLKLISYSLGESVTNEQGISEDLGSAMTFGLDVGGTAQLWDRFKLGAAFHNINRPQFGSTVAKRNLPQVFTAGIGYLPYYGVRTSFDIERLISGETQFKGGLNATIVKPLDLRFGVFSNPNCFTTGFGLRFRELVVDYAFIYHPELNPSHQIGIGFNLDRSITGIWHGERKTEQRSPKEETISFPSPQPTQIREEPIPVPPAPPVQTPAEPVLKEIVPDTTGAAERAKLAEFEADKARIQPLCFEYKQSQLPSSEQSKITANVELFRKWPDARIMIEGHCDERGSTEYNYQLGLRRAEAAKEALVKAGIETTRITIISKSEEQPVDFNHNEAAWSKNRRAEFRLQLETIQR